MPSYFLYNSASIAFGAAYNNLFLVYVAIYALSAVAFFINLHGIEVARLPAQVSQRFSRRLFIGLTFGPAAAQAKSRDRHRLPLVHGIARFLFGF